MRSGFLGRLESRGISSWGKRSVLGLYPPQVQARVDSLFKWFSAKCQVGINRQSSVGLLHPSPWGSGCRFSAYPRRQSTSKLYAVLDNLPSSTETEDGILQGQSMTRRYQLDGEMIQQLMDLPGTKTWEDMDSRAVIMKQWRSNLGKGILPRVDPESDWPAEPFRSKLLEAMKSLGLPRFCRRYPALLNSVLKQALLSIHEFELAMQALDQKQDAPKAPQEEQGSDPMEGSDGATDQDMGEGEGTEEQDGDDVQDQNGSPGSQKEGEKKEIEVSLEDKDGAGGAGEESEKESLEGLAEQLAEELAEKFEEEWKPVLDNVQAAQDAFDNIDELMDDGKKGFDASAGVWKSRGWAEVSELRKKLESLTELRELVRALGRGAGKGPIRRAPEQVYSGKPPLGVIRSPLQPEETRGLTRSGDLSRMLPFEAHLLAAGWPKNYPAAFEGDDCEDDEEERDLTRRQGSQAARRLFMARRVERNLMSYERTGWVDDEPSRLTGRMEIRPASEQGPIIVCLDTSGSMMGARETVAKAVTLECMRGAYRQKRACFLYAFSGPSQVQELELKMDSDGLPKLLEFLTCTFDGGTDVDEPLKLSLQRLTDAKWQQADILMVTDGEIPMPSKAVQDQLKGAIQDLGLEVHGLMVSSQASRVMDEICTHIHVFKAWDTVRDKRDRREYQPY